MSPQPPPFADLELKIERLRREYDLYLAGERRIEPVKLRDEIERELLGVIGSPLLNTAERFRIGTLAHRFRALETRIRNLQEMRSSRRARGRGGGAGEGADVVLDRALLESPGGVDRYVRRLFAEVEQATGGRPGITYEELRDRLVGSAKRYLEREGVWGVRFRVERDGERPRIRGKVLRDPGR